MKIRASTIPEAQAARQVERVIASGIFAKAARSQRFLRYLVAAALEDPQQTIKEYTVAMEVFDRGPDYDPAVDATVRVEVGRLRTRLREYYGAEGREDPLLIELPKGAYRVVLTIREEAEGDPGEYGVEEEPYPAPIVVPALPQARRRLVGAFPRRYALLLLCLGFLIGAVAWRLARPEHQQPAIHSIAVLPLKNLSGDPRQDYFADGTTDELITELARIPSLRVVSWNSALQEKDTTKSLRTIAKELRADALVEGSVDRYGNAIRINAQLIDTRTDTHLWAASFEGRASQIMALENKAAEEIVAQTQVEIGQNAAIPRLSPSLSTLDPAVQEACLRGKNYFDKRQGRASAEQFQLAIDLNPGYAPAYAGLAVGLESESMLGEARPEQAIPQAMAAAERSLQLDPENGDALIARGSIEMNFLWRWQAAERDLTRGVELSPNNSFGHMMLSIYEDAVGRPGEAVSQMQDAVEIDPLSFFMARHYGSTLFYARRYGEALQQLQYAREMHPESAAVVDGWISAAYEKEGKYNDAIRYDLLQTREEDPKADVGKLLATYQEKGWQSYWALHLQMLRREKNADPCWDYFVGLDAMRAGRPDEAIAALKNATEQHCFWMNTTRSNPLFDQLRGDRGFNDVIAELHLSVAAQP
jgi:TolB-like protein